MVKVFPFHGILYNKDKLKKNLSSLFAPPYDVINPEEQDAFYESNDFNFVRLILGKEFADDSEYNNKYVRSAAFLDGWLRHKILLQDKKPALYIYEQRFFLGGRKFSRLGFIGLLRLEDMGKGKVFPHEDTYPKAKQDRLQLMRSTACNLESIFALFDDENQKVEKLLKNAVKKRPFIEVTDKQRVTHRLWRADHKSVIGKIVKEMKDKAVFIADGHHRYEAAIRYKNELKLRNTKFSEEEAYNHMMVYFNSIEDKGLIVLPIHRVLRQLSFFDKERFKQELAQYFYLTEYKAGKQSAPKTLRKLLRDMQKKGQAAHVFGLYMGEHKYYLLTLKDENSIEEMITEDKSKTWKKLDATIVHYAIFDRILGIANQTAEKVVYTHNAEEAVKMVNEKGFQAAILLNPTKISEIVAIASKLEKMPHKSTFFYPKLLSGLVVNKIVHGEKIKL
ncbi:MAG: DUF1015 domain-containing protein [Candidatus Margulisbacteria bacterium]|nr:DUF1015 domain-containing protein [Candidatus Margulisiibacteriota bacterium]